MIQGIDAIKISVEGWIVGGFCDCQMVLEVQLFDWGKISVLVFSRQESYSFKIIFFLFIKRNVLMVISAILTPCFGDIDPPQQV